MNIVGHKMQKMKNRIWCWLVSIWSICPIIHSFVHLHTKSTYYALTCSLCTLTFFPPKKTNPVVVVFLQFLEHVESFFFFFCNTTRTANPDSCRQIWVARFFFFNHEILHISCVYAASFHMLPGLGAATRPPSIFHAIMHILSRQIGLISITLPQSGMDCALTSLPDPRWRRSSSQSLEKCPAGFGENRSDYRSRPLALRWALSHPFHISQVPSNSFPRKNELPSSHSEHRDYGKLQVRESSRWTRLRASLSGLLLSSSRLLVFRLKYHSAGDESDTGAVLTDARWYFMAKANRIIVVQQRAFARFSDNKASLQNAGD